MSSHYPRPPTNIHSSVTSVYGLRQLPPPPQPILSSSYAGTHMWGFFYTIITLSYAKMTEKAQDGRWGWGGEGPK